MKNQIINIPATTFSGLANHFRDMHPEGIKGAVVPLDDVFGSIRQQGGKWLFALSTDKLVDLYTSYGFVPVAWLQWDNAQAPASWDYDKYGRPSHAFFVHRYYLTPAQCETYEAGRHMVCTYDDGLNLVLKLVSWV
jgi:hypothetical protein